MALLALPLLASEASRALGRPQVASALFAVFLVVEVVPLWDLTLKLLRARPVDGLERHLPGTRRAFRILWVILVLFFTVVVALGLVDLVVILPGVTAP